MDVLDILEIVNFDNYSIKELQEFYEQLLYELEIVQLFDFSEDPEGLW